MKHAPWILPIIVVAQFAGGSLWFSGNAIINDLIHLWGISEHSVSYVTSAVQFGFIIGTLVFAYFTLADRFSPKKIFFFCACLGALSNSSLIFLPEKLATLVTIRFCTGFFLAGIYPVGMKIAANLYTKGLGKALGFLVGALAIGTAFPHSLQAFHLKLSWQTVLLTTSLLAMLGGLSILLVVPEKNRTGNIAPFDPTAFFRLLKNPKVRSASYGYFGHMWELYTFWAFIPLFLSLYSQAQNVGINVPLWSFIIIASGFLGGSIGGIFSTYIGSARVALYQLAFSGSCCLFSPLFFFLPAPLFLTIMTLWGICAAGDSPQYSTLIAQHAPKNLVGSSLTLVNSIGFFLTIVSIHTLDIIKDFIHPQSMYLILLPGPILGLYYMKDFLQQND